MEHYLTILITVSAILKESSSSSCIEWVSSLDGRYRKHCYWFNSSSLMTAFEADAHCALSGGRLAPYIDGYQYSFLVELRPPTASSTFIGTMDITEENTWVNFDGSSIPGNEFLFTMTNYPISQPNGGSSQNCAVLNPKNYGGVYFDNRTQDKSCSYLTTDMLCYTEDWTNLSLSWKSSADQKFREHYYWLTFKTANQTTWTVMDAMDKCRREGGHLAPVIDDDQLTFITNLISSVASTTGIDPTDLWLGLHNINDRPWNWNGDPSVATTIIGAPSGEECFLIFTFGTQFWRDCDFSDPSSISGALCYKEGIVTKAKRTPQNGNAMSAEEIKQELYVSPKDTNAFKLTKISVYEDRPAAVAMGAVGIGVLASVIIFIVLLDCQQMVKLCSKEQKVAMGTKN